MSSSTRSRTKLGLAERGSVGGDQNELGLAGAEALEGCCICKRQASTG